MLKECNWILHGVAVQNDGARRRFPLGGRNDTKAAMTGEGEARQYPAHSRSAISTLFPPASRAHSRRSSIQPPTRISVRTFSAFLKTFYYFSLHDQIASYRASLRHGAIGLGSLHFAYHAVHGGERLSGRAFDYANYLQQQRRAQTDAGGNFAEADGAGVCTDCALLCEAQEGMRVQARDRPGRLAVGSFAGHSIIRKEHSESRPDDACESQAGVADFRCGGLLDALPR